MTSPSQPLQISVVIPCYNVAQYLDECLQSLVEQTYPHFEAILINDASLDETGKKCDVWAEQDSRIRVIHQEKNRGVSVARNIGIREAQNDWILFLDSDDYIAPQHIATLVETATKHHADVAHCGYYRQNTQDGSKRENGMGFRTITPIREIIIALIEDKKTGSFLWRNLFHRSLLEGVTFPEGEIFEDFRLLPYIYEKAHTLAHTGQATYYYRFVPTSIIHAPNISKEIAFFDANIARFNYLKASQVLTDREKKLFAVFIKKSLLRTFHKSKQLARTSGLESDQKSIERMRQDLLNLGIKPSTALPLTMRYFLLSLGKRYAERVISAEHPLQ